MKNVPATNSGAASICATSLHQRGFSLIELMITIAIAAILLMVAVPSFDNALLNSKLASQSNSLLAGLQLARSEAIKRNAAVTICASDGSASAPDCTNSGNWSNGWLIVLADDTVVHHGERAANGFVLTGPGSGVSFSGNGMTGSAEIFTLCRAKPSVGSTQRTITITATGRANVSTDPGGSACPSS